jgi:predicted nucleic acid-binding protein
MPEQWVVNASPLIVLGKIGQLDLLTKLPQRIVVPAAVVTEILAGPEGDAARLAIQTKMFTKVNTPAIVPELAAWDLGAGETSVLAYALAHPGWITILDDGAARKCAKTFGIPMKGTLAVVILAKKRGLIPSAAKVLHAIQEAGLRLDEGLIRIVLKQTVGEDW